VPTKELTERITTMASPHSIEAAQLLEQHLQGASPDLLRQMIGSLANAMMSAQACGAGYGQRSDERVNRRNGYRAREWDIRAGTIELAGPVSLPTGRKANNSTAAEKSAMSMIQTAPTCIGWMNP
jgi:transposase-like protein